MGFNAERLEFPFSSTYEHDDTENWGLIMPLDAAFAYCCIDPWSLHALAEQSKTYELCLLCAKTAGVWEGDSRTILSAVPKKFRTYELCMYAIERNARALESVPREIIDYAMAEKAISIDGYSLLYVPKHLQRCELCRLAVETNGEAFLHIRPEQRSEELYRLAILQPKARKILENVNRLLPFPR